MRIIAGEFRGRKLLPPEGDVTRPITDRVKQSLFDIIAFGLEGARVYDCFSGTGSMGLECLSRGAAHATFFDADASALKRLAKNIETLGVKDRSKVIKGDLFRWFATAPPSKADFVFLDPPYRFLNEQPDKLVEWAGHIVKHLAPTGQVVFRHDAKDTLSLPPLNVVETREYGGMVIEFLQPPADPTQTEAGGPPSVTDADP